MLLAIMTIVIVTIATFVLLAAPGGASASTTARQAHAKKKASHKQTKITRCVVVKSKHASGKSSSRRSATKGRSVVCTVFHLRPGHRSRPVAVLATLGYRSNRSGRGQSAGTSAGSAKRRTDFRRAKKSRPAKNRPKNPQKNRLAKKRLRRLKARHSDRQHDAATSRRHRYRRLRRSLPVRRPRLPAPSRVSTSMCLRRVQPLRSSSGSTATLLATRRCC